MTIRIQPGDRLTFAEERNPYTVQAVSSDGRWVAASAVRTKAVSR